MRLPVDVVSQHDWRCLVHGDRDHARDEGRRIGKGVGSDIEHISWEAGLCSIVEYEGDTVASVGGDGPVLLVVADKPTM